MAPMYYAAVAGLALMLQSATAFVRFPAPAVMARSMAMQPLRMAAESAYEKARAEAEAMEAKHGKGSKEASVAWDIVEELEASDNSAATKPPLDDACAVQDSELCAQYGEQLEELKMLISSKPQEVQVEELTKAVDFYKRQNEALKEKIMRAQTVLQKGWEELK